METMKFYCESNGYFTVCEVTTDNDMDYDFYFDFLGYIQAVHNVEYVQDEKYYTKTVALDTCYNLSGAVVEETMDKDYWGEGEVAG